MSRRKRGRPKIITDDGSPPQQAVIGTRPGALEEARERWREEGRRALQQDVDAKIDQVRADAQALETSALLLEKAPIGFYPLPHKAETIAALFALAAGMRLAADRMPDSREVPF